MPEQALYLKWRPTAFDEVVGQEHIIRTLRNSLKTGRIRHAYLFSGPRGTGKTTSARLLAKAVNCTHPDPEMRPCNACSCCIAVNEGRFLDLIEIDAASHTGVDDVRDLREKIAFSPSEGKYKVYIIDEVHRFSGNAFDALLKTLEEPPDHALFVLATTEIDKVPATIRSRCLPFEFRRLTLHEVTERLASIAESEGIKIEHAALELIAREGTGSVRDSISLLDQVVADPAEMVTLELTQRILGTASAQAVRKVIAAIVDKDLSLGIHLINDAIDNGSDPRQFGQQVVEQLRYVLLTQTASVDLVPASQDDKRVLQELASSITRTDLLRALRAFNEAVTHFSSGWQPQLPLEMALMESLQAPEVLTIPQENLFGTPPQAPSLPNMPAPTVIATPGQAPAIPTQLVAQKWVDAQRLINENIPKVRPEVQKVVGNLPHLMQQVHVRAVDGNLVIVGGQKIYSTILLSDPMRVEWIERALFRVTNVQLRVRIIEDDGHASETRYMTPSPDSNASGIEQFLMETGGVMVEEFNEDDTTSEEI